MRLRHASCTNWTSQTAGHSPLVTHPWVIYRHRCPQPQTVRPGGEGLRCCCQRLAAPGSHCCCWELTPLRLLPWRLLLPGARVLWEGLLLLVMGSGRCGSGAPVVVHQSLQAQEHGDGNSRQVQQVIWQHLHRLLVPCPGVGEQDAQGGLSTPLPHVPTSLRCHNFNCKCRTCLLASPLHQHSFPPTPAQLSPRGSCVCCSPDRSCSFSSREEVTPVMADTSVMPSSSTPPLTISVVMDTLR